MARSDRLLRRAKLETQLKLGPQADALAAILADSAAQYSRTRKVNASNSAGIAAAIDHASPAVSDAFGQALATVHAQQAALGGLGGSSAVPAEQAQAYDRRVGEQLANAMTDLTAQRTAAVTGRVYADQSARDSYLAEKAKIQQQSQSLAGQKGLLTATTYGDLKDAAAQRGLTRRGQTLAHQDRVRGQDLTHKDAQAKIDAANAKKSKPKLLPLAAQNATQDAVSTAQRTAKEQIGYGVKGPALLKLLTEGRPAQTVQGVKVPAIPKQPPVVARAGYELATKGYITAPTVKRLHQRGVKVHLLGPTTPPVVAGIPVQDITRGVQGALP